LQRGGATVYTGVGLRSSIAGTQSAPLSAAASDPQCGAKSVKPKFMNEIKQNLVWRNNYF
jgi:hypothetical protein